jgi:hypothetical protein
MPRLRRSAFPSSASRWADHGHRRSWAWSRTSTGVLNRARRRHRPPARRLAHLRSASSAPAGGAGRPAARNADYDSASSARRSRSSIPPTRSTTRFCQPRRKRLCCTKWSAAARRCLTRSSRTRCPVRRCRHRAADPRLAWPTLPSTTQSATRHAWRRALHRRATTARLLSPPRPPCGHHWKCRVRWPALVIARAQPCWSRPSVIRTQ